MTCTSSVSLCEVMRTCPCCKRVLATRGGQSSHERACKQPMDVEYRDFQWAHWKEHHNHFAEKARRRMSRR